MSFFEDLFEGRRGGHHGGYGHRDQHGDRDEHGDYDHHDSYRAPDSLRVPVETRGPQITCGRCQAPVAVLPGFRFCPYCGGPLSAPASCPACGVTRVAGAAFCAGCGTKL
jgi:hypothetical protein